MEQSLIIPERIKLLIVKYLSEGLDSTEILELAGWLKENPSGMNYIREYATAWILSGNSDLKSGFNSEESFRKLMEKIKAEKKAVNIVKSRKILRWMVAAATALIFIAAGSLFAILTGRVKTPAIVSASRTEIVCPLGSKTKIFLADGSEVWLNAGSKLSFQGDISITERIIELEGEAFFNVESSKSRPFKVKTTSMLIKAMGTKFNVKSYPGENTESATLVEGRIEIEINKTGNQNKKYLLNPNQKLIVNNEVSEVVNLEAENKKAQKTLPAIPARIDLVSNVKTELFTSWKDEIWIIEREPMGSLATMLERKFNVKFRFVDPELKDYRFTGAIQNETFDQILEALRLTAPLRFVTEKDSVIVYTDPVLKEKYQKIVTRK